MTEELSQEEERAQQREFNRVFMAANESLKVQVRKIFVERKIPLNTRFQCDPIGEDMSGQTIEYDKPIRRAVVVYQVFPVKRKFILFISTLTLQWDEENGPILFRHWI